MIYASSRSHRLSRIRNQDSNGLHVVRHRKGVKPANPRDPVSILGKESQVAGEGCDVAPDVNDRRRIGSRDRRDNIAAKPAARRIAHHHVGRLELSHGWSNAADDGGDPQIIQRALPSRERRTIGVDDFDGGNVEVGVEEGRTEHASTAVQIPHVHWARRSVLRHQRDDRVGVHLWCIAMRLPETGRLDRPFSLSDNESGLPAARDEVRRGNGSLCSPTLRGGTGIATPLGRLRLHFDDVDVVVTVSHDDHLATRSEPQTVECVVHRRVQRRTLLGHDPIVVVRMEPGMSLPVGGESGPHPPRATVVVDSDQRLDVGSNGFKTPDAGQRIREHLGLQFPGETQFGMRQVAAASSGSRGRTRGLLPVRTGVENLDQFRMAERWFAIVDDPRANPLTRQCAAYEHHTTVDAPNRRPAVGKTVKRYLNDATEPSTLLGIAHWPVPVPERVVSPSARRTSPGAV